MPVLCRAYASVSPWNVRDLSFGDYARLLQALAEEAKAEAKAMSPAKG
jgi:hypothetical protein